MRSGLSDHLGGIHGVLGARRLAQQHARAHRARAAGRRLPRDRDLQHQQSVGTGLLKLGGWVDVMDSCAAWCLGFGLVLNPRFDHDVLSLMPSPYGGNRG